MEKVLILVVVEDGLAHYNYERYKEHSRGLNPYCSGRWPRTLKDSLDKSEEIQVVLILVVVEDGLVQSARGKIWSDFSIKSLNPCCSGRWSRTPLNFFYKFLCIVLILVVVDDGLVLKVQYTFGTIKKCLNPCCSGQWSRTRLLVSITTEQEKS